MPTVFTPPPERVGSLRVGETDSRYRDFGPDLQPLGDTVTSASVSVARRDGQAMTGSDLAVAPSPALVIDSTGMIVTWWITKGIAAADYIMTITATTAQQRTLVRDVYILAAGALG